MALHNAGGHPAPVLAAEGLVLGYGDAPLTRPLHLELRPGTLVALLGANGVGKSTLLRTLAGLHPPRAGLVWVRPPWNGQTVLLHRLSANARARVCSIVLTERADADMTVFDMVALGRYPYRSWSGGLSSDDEAHITRALAMTDTAGFAARPVSQLSDGERQRVLVARAVAQAAPIMLLDEPSAFLDYPHRARLMALLRDLAWKTGIAVLVSTHDLETALAYADRAWLMTEGRVIDGVPEALALDGALTRAFGMPLAGTDEAALPVRVAGEGDRAAWTRRALARVAARLHPEVTLVEVLENEWRVHRLSDAPSTMVATSISGLIDAVTV